MHVLQSFKVFRHWRLVFFLKIFFAIQTIWSVNTYAENIFLEPTEAFKLTINKHDPTSGDTVLRWDIEPGYYLYRDRIEIKTPSGEIIESVKFPQGKIKNDPTFGVTEVYYDQLELSVNASPDTQALTVDWQGCAEVGLCYLPQTTQLTFKALTDKDVQENKLGTDNAKITQDTSKPTSLLSTAKAGDSQIRNILEQYSLAWTIPIFFLMGIALTFTPCVLPMMPIISSITVGSQAPPRRAFLLTLVFILPMAFTYALLGAVAALTGAQLQVVLQNPWVLIAFSAIFLLLALAMFGIFTLQLPAFIRDRLNNANQGVQGGTFIGAAIMGLLSALLVGPCMTAPLAGTLLYIAQTGSIIKGTLLLFALGLGMGLPLLAIGTLGVRFLPRPGEWMNIVKGAFGFLLLATGVWMLERVISGPQSLILWGILFISISMSINQLVTKRTTTAKILGQTFAIVVVIWSGILFLGAATGGNSLTHPLIFPQNTTTITETTTSDLQFKNVRNISDLDEQLTVAKTNEQTVILDFSADWCVSCKVIEREVFSAPEIHKALKDTLLLRADVTEGNAEQQAIMKKYKVLGPPTIILFSPQGEELRDARLVGEFGIKDLLGRLASAKESSR